MSAAIRPSLWSPATASRAYFAVQALAGALWWVAVFSSDDVRRWTLGGWDPRLLAGPDLVLFAGASAVAAAWSNRLAALVAAAWTTGMTVALLAYGLVTQRAGWGVVLMVVASAATLVATSELVLGRLPTRWFFVGPFRFREAEEASDARHLRRSLSQLVVFWTTFFVIVPLVLAAVEQRLRLPWPVLQHRAWDVVGAGTFLIASGLGLWSCVTMAKLGKGTPLPSETARELVIAGPYRVVRNPMAVAGALQTAGVGLWRGSWTVVAIAAVGAVAWHTIIRPEEEADLATRFGDPYERYRRSVRCWVPAMTCARATS